MNGEKNDTMENANLTKNRNLIIGIVVGIIAVIALVIGGGVYYYTTYLVVHEIKAKPMNLEIGSVVDIDAEITPDTHMDRIAYEIVTGQDYIMVNNEGQVTVSTRTVPEGEELCQVKISASNGVETVVDITLENIEITVPEERIVLELGESYTLTPTILSKDTTIERTFSFETSDSEVVTVGEEGEIEAGIFENGGETRTGVVTITSENGLEKQVEVEVRDTFYSDISQEIRHHTNYNAGYEWSGNTAVFKNEIMNCTALSMSHIIKDNAGYTGGNFEVYGISSTGKWTKIGDFTCGEVNTFTNVDFTFTPINIKEVALIPSTMNGEWTHSFWFTDGEYQ